jgi:hypothetical protein
MNIAERQLGKTLGQPLTARRLCPWRSRHGGRAHLELFQLMGMRTEPAEDFVHGAKLGDARHPLLRRAQTLRITR